MKYALVTGGPRGIGRAICIKLAGMGYFVLINYLSNEEEANNTLNMVREAGGNGLLMKFDVADRNLVESVLGRWQEEHQDQYIEVLINNAGIRKDTLLMWMENSHWHDVINTNLSGFFYVTRFILKNMLINKNGRIVNVVSLSGIKGLPGQVNYSAACAGLEGFTRALAMELGPYNINVNCIAPDFIDTEMTRVAARREGMYLNDLKRFVTAEIPLRRLGTPADVANVALFLVSEESSFVSGQILYVRGGP